jgi:hypothetical protein
MSNSFREICQGERPWTSLGNFLNYWFAYAKDQREALVADPLPEYNTQSEYQHQWALFCAAGVEWLCDKHQLPCPTWVHDPKFNTPLPSPWFFRETEHAKARLFETTPEIFRRRNIFCGDDVFANKWEFMEQLPAFIEKIQKQKQATQTFQQH